MWYLNETQKNDLSHISALKYYTTGDFMLLDVSSRRNLELTETMREKNKKGSLLSVLDKTQTAMGARLLRKWVEQPLLSKEESISVWMGWRSCSKTCSSERKLRKFSIPCMTLNVLCPVWCIRMQTQGIWRR